MNLKYITIFYLTNTMDEITTIIKQQIDIIYQIKTLNKQIEEKIKPLETSMKALIKLNTAPTTIKNKKEKEIEKEIEKEVKKRVIKKKNEKEVEKEVIKED